MEISVNLNEVVRVRLTAFGEAVYAKHLLDEYESLGGSLSPHGRQGLPESAALHIFQEKNKPDQDGCRTFQLHELFYIFGRTAHITAQQVALQGNAFLLKVVADQGNSSEESTESELG